MKRTLSAAPALSSRRASAASCRSYASSSVAAASAVVSLNALMEDSRSRTWSSVRAAAAAASGGRDFVTSA